MTAAPPLPFIPDIAEEHLEELQFLWGRRRLAIHSPAYREHQIGMLDERIEARRQGLVVLGDHVEGLTAAALAGDDEMQAFAAAFVLLGLPTSAAHTRVVDAFRTASGPRLHGLRDALAHGAPVATTELTFLFLSGPVSLGAAAGEILAFHTAVSPRAQDLERLIRAEEPSVRAAGWRLAAYCGVAVPTPWYEAGFGDDDPAVKGTAVGAAAWNRSPTFHAHARGLAAKPAPEAIDALSLFSSLILPEDYPLIAAVATNPAAGPNRFRVVGSFAHPYFIDLLIQEMSNPDPASAVAAGAAFLKMTGREVESNTRVKVSPDGKPPADDFEAEFMDEVFLPDPELARKHWQELAPTLARSPRICRGMDVSQPLSREQFALLDMESRYDYCLRARLFSGWQGTPLVLERYPQRF